MLPDQVIGQHQPAEPQRLGPPRCGSNLPGIPRTTRRKTQEPERAHPPHLHRNRPLPRIGSASSTGHTLRHTLSCTRARTASRRAPGSRASNNNRIPSGWRATWSTTSSSPPTRSASSTQPAARSPEARLGCRRGQGARRDYTPRRSLVYGLWWRGGVGRDRGIAGRAPGRVGCPRPTPADARADAESDRRVGCISRGVFSSPGPRSIAALSFCARRRS